MSDPLVETWEIHDRINRYLLKAIAPEAMESADSPKSRNVFQLFAHMHNVRLMWLKTSAPALLEGLAKVEGTNGKKEQLAKALEASGAAVRAMIEQGVEVGRIKNFKPHPTAFVGYLISHESHHRGQIGWALKHSGHPLDKKTAFGLWEWGVR